MGRKTKGGQSAKSEKSGAGKFDQSPKSTKKRGAYDAVQTQDYGDYDDEYDDEMDYEVEQ